MQTAPLKFCEELEAIDLGKGENLFAKRNHFQGVGSTRESELR
jgi:hypothetical protein